MRFSKPLRWAKPAAIALVVWALAAGYGGTRLLVQLPGRVHAERLAEDVQRNLAWSPIYGFADVCQTRIPSSASVLLVDPTGATNVVPAAERTGPAAFGLPADLDWPNQAVLAYVLYPASVSAVGHVPVDWPAAIGSAGYVAVWEQHAYRSADALAAARQAEAALSSNPNALQVCSYASADGDRGLVYRVSAGAASATLGGAPNLFGGRLGAYVKLLLGLGSLWLIGFILIRAAARNAISQPLGVGASLPLGCLAVTLQLVAFSISGIGWSGPVLAAPWVAATAAVAWRDRRALLRFARQISARTLTAWWTSASATERLALAALAGVCLVITAGAPLGLPWSDGFNLYYFKSRAFFGSGSVVPYYQHAQEMLFSFPAHPPLVSLSVTWLYLFIGEVDEHVTLLLWPALLLSLLAILYALVRASLERGLALWFVLAAALVGYELSTQALLASFADLPLAVFLLLACGSLWLWAGDENRPTQLLSIAGLSLGGAALTKEEGLVAAPLILVATPLLLGRKVAPLAPSRLKPAAVAFPIFAVIAGPWLALRASFHLPEMTVHLGGNVSTMLARLPVAVEGLGARAAIPLLPFLALTLIALLSRSRLGLRALSGRFWFLLAVIGFQLGIDAVAIAAAPVEIHHQLSIAATRLISQVLPLAFLASVEVWLLIAEPDRLRAAERKSLPKAVAVAPPS